jgi:hypothetical protein
MERHSADCLPPRPKMHESPPPSEPSPLVSVAKSLLSVVGSLLLTVVILFFLIFVLLVGTVEEKYYGATGAKFGIYGTWWFNGIGFLLAGNSLASLIRHLPWKRQQMGFIIPHLGLIVLLTGCYLSRRYGVEATIAIEEGGSSDLAYKTANQHVELDGQQLFSLRVGSSDSELKAAKPIVVPFTSGPFNWRDFHNGTLSYLPWALAHRDQGILYDHDGIRLEVLDYFSNSRIVGLPSLMVQAVPPGSDGGGQEEPPVTRFAVTPAEGPHVFDRRNGTGDDQVLASGQRVVFWMIRSAEETAAFRQSKPQGPLGRGHAVLYAGGKAYDLPTDGWERGTRRKLGDSGLEAELVGIDTEEESVQQTPVLDARLYLMIHRGAQARPMLLSSEFPCVLSRQDYADGVFGSYWPGLPPKPAGDTNKSPGEAPPSFGPPRIEFVQGADEQLYMRTWRTGQVTISGPLKMNESGGRITAFRDTPEAVVLKFGDFSPVDEPSYTAQGRDFDKSDDRPHVRQAFVRLTVDDHREEFWMPCNSPDASIRESLKQITVRGKNRQVALEFAPEQFHLGYTFHLRNAYRRLDPGTGQASFYGSEIDLEPREDIVDSSLASGKGAPPKFEDLMVTLNAPLDLADPAHPGRSYRIFQSSMTPINPEDFDFKTGKAVYVSGLTLNYDPGRGLTYLGCLLVVAGIFVAYFVRFKVRRQ